MSFVRLIQFLVTLSLFFCGAYSVADQIQPADDAPQPVSPAESAARMRLPEGFRIELVASEPVIQEPSCIAFDEHGRIFVSELHGYNVEGELDVAELNKTGKLDTEVRRLRWEFLGGKVAEESKLRQFGKVKLLRDTNGDGRMDESIVWADDLPPAYGLVPARGGIIVVAAPDIVFLADRDLDGKPEIRETLFTGFNKREMERGINNPRWGLDNWIYVGAGGHGGKITGPHLKEAVDLQHSDFRIKADGSAIEQVTGRVGTFGVAMNDVGDRFPCSGGQPAIYALPMPYNMLTRNPHVAMPSTNHSAANYGQGFRISDPHPWRIRRRQDPAWIKFYGNRETDSNYFTGGCGAAIYSAGLFPEEFHGSFFYCEPSLNIIHRCVLSRDGAGYKSRRAETDQKSEFLASKDQWFRPMNLRIGPDGAMYIIDMYREIIEDYSAIPRFLQQQYGLDKGRDRGRIWRLLPKDATTKPPQDFAKAKTSELIKLLGDTNMRTRLTAQRLLIEREKEQPATDTLEAIRVIMHSGPALGRLHAIHTLNGIGKLIQLDLNDVIADDDYRVRLHALRLATNRAKTDKALEPALEEAILRMKTDPDAAVRLQLALTLGELSDTKAQLALATLATNHGQERWMAQAILSSATKNADAILHSILSDTASNNADELLEPLAKTIAAQRSGPVIASLLKTLIDSTPQRQARCLSGLSEGLLRGTDPIPALSDSELKPLRVIIQSNATSESTVASHALKVAAKLASPASELSREVFKQSSKTALDRELDLQQRTSAIDTLADAPFELMSNVADELLDSRESPEIQHAAIDVLSRSKHTEVTALLTSKWLSYTPPTRKRVVKALLARQDRFASILQTVSAKVLSVNDFDDSQREQLSEAEDPTIAAKAKSLFAKTSSDTSIRDRIKKYEVALSADRDIDHGKTLFEKVCLNCHKIGDKGHDVGAPLGSIINKPDEAILADILDPSAKIESEYKSYTVVTTSGQTFTGVLASESATSISLRMETGKTEEILRNEVELIRGSEVSLMPSNLHEQINPKAMADLLGYLRVGFSE